MITRQLHPRKRRHRRVRAKVKGTSKRLRLNVFRSNRFTYAQLIDDKLGVTLAFVSDRDQDPKKGGKRMTKGERAAWVGKEIGTRAKKIGVEKIVFDRGGYQYHGRVKAVAEALRKQGLKF